MVMTTKLSNPHFPSKKGSGNENAAVKISQAFK
jgi:hypothetical protein